MGNGFTLSVAEGEWVYPERSRRGMEEGGSQLPDSIQFGIETAITL